MSEPFRYKARRDQILHSDILPTVARHTWKIDSIYSPNFNITSRLTFL